MQIGGISGDHIGDHIFMITMHQRQNFRLIFFPKSSNTNKNGETPVYCRFTIDGLQDEFSTGRKIRKEHWDDKAKTVVETMGIVGLVLESNLLTFSGRNSMDFLL